MRPEAPCSQKRGFAAAVANGRWPPVSSDPRGGVLLSGGDSECDGFGTNVRQVVSVRRVEHSRAAGAGCHRRGRDAARLTEVQPVVAGGRDGSLRREGCERNGESLAKSCVCRRRRGQTDRISGGPLLECVRGEHRT
jgi:hypothetical protein